ncbi:ATP-binding protein [Streptomyces sp. NPDC002769]|uniref:ATP-binding protein n=1 Tax=Streptomyces sp. NPDC002769 TaxID=3154542 RepID=UPI003319973F
MSSTSSTTVSANSGTATSASSRPLATEIIVSELVTNAIRHGTPPVRLRLIKDRFLTCEVPDASPAAPHLRHARTLDEGGRGLFVVAQLAQHWGTRCTGSGKTIWTEQALSRQPVRQPER